MEPEAGRLAGRLAAALRHLDSRPGWKALERQVARTATGGSKPVPVEVYGLGRRERFDQRRLAQWLTATLKAARREGRREVEIVLPDHPVARGRNSLRILTQLLSSGYEYQRYKARSRRPRLRKIHLLPPSGEDQRFRLDLRSARPISRAIRFAKDLGNSPPGWRVSGPLALSLLNAHTHPRREPAGDFAGRQRRDGP